MNKKFVKFTAAALSVLLTVTMLAGCGGKDKNVNNGSSENDERVTLPLKNPITLKFWCVLPPSATTIMSDLGQSEFYKELEKRTGIHVEFIHPSEGNAKEQFNLMIASRELPDIIDGDFNQYSGGQLKAYQD